MAKVYESEHTQFMRTWLQQHPEQTTEKLRGRRLWWDQAPQSLDEMTTSAPQRWRNLPMCITPKTRTKGKQVSR